MKNLIAFLFFLATACSITLAVAAPGAHGPNGEHLDTPGTHATQASAAGGPRLEAVTESFELVGSLQDEELSIVIDRFDTNEPVLGAQLEVESDGRKVLASFHADHGDYSVDDKAFLQMLTKPGKHALVFTLTAGAQSDLLEAVLETAPGDDPAGGAHAEAHEQGHALRNWLIAGGVLAILSAVCLAFFMRARQRRHSRNGT